MFTLALRSRISVEDKGQSFLWTFLKELESEFKRYKRGEHFIIFARFKAVSIFSCPPPPSWDKCFFFLFVGYMIHLQLTQGETFQEWERKWK